MGLIENIFESLGLQDLVCEKDSRITLIGKTACYIEGVKSIKSYSNEEVFLRLKDGEFIITGEELFIKKYCEGDIAICGKIVKIERL